ncbi:uncharacterized protein CEXT_185921 [Caerostris extrusa]|uniref:Uncharacterized protein n=1 Tax=Caerostris extrusa TaxID=172846 RepID=A0AAV4MKM0_CAEEX|nr:uncharacterized protein CEXT_185921 [Caerostris extrusa]
MSKTMERMVYNRLNWYLESHSLLAEEQAGFKNLNQLFTTDWRAVDGGCSRSTLNTTYKTFVLPVITYCCEPLISASKPVRKSLETFHNQALRLITGAVETSPIDAMLFVLETGH